jgi:DNA-binding MarR family transcriptional regulator
MTGASHTDLGSVLRLAVLRLSRRLRQESAGEITPSQLSALTVLARHGELTLGELASIERIAPPSMTRIAARLESSGLLERRSDTADRRVARVAISPAGQRLLQEHRARGDAFVSSRLESLTAEELEVLARAVPLLERLASEQVHEADVKAPR